MKSAVRQIVTLLAIIAIAMVSLAASAEGATCELEERSARGYCPGEAGHAAEAGVFELYVDGAIYTPTKVSGPVRHYETPHTSPLTAYSDRHTWTGNGSKHLPCEGGIHWIDNENELTISNCLELPPPSSTTTTTSIPTTSTTTVETTTTTVPPTTTTSVEGTTTTERSTTTTTPEASSTTEPETESTITSTSQPSTSTSMSELPYTGAGSGVLALYGAILAISGLSVLAYTRREI